MPVAVAGVGEAEQRHVRVGVGDLGGVDAADVCDHDVGRLDALVGDHAVAGQQRLAARPESVGSTPTSRIRRHA